MAGPAALSDFGNFGGRGQAVEFHAPQHAQIRSKLHEFTRYVGSPNDFPGSQVVSLTNHNVADLVRNPYVACEKSDGTRYFLLAGKSRWSYLIGRKNDIIAFQNFWFPRKNKSPDGEPPEAQEYTLLDGEMVTDKIKLPRKKETKERAAVESSETQKMEGDVDHGAQAKGEESEEDEDDPPGTVLIHRFLVFDCLRVDNEDVTQLNFLERLRRAYEDVILPKREFDRREKEKEEKREKEKEESEREQKRLRGPAPGDEEKEKGEENGSAGGVGETSGATVVPAPSASSPAPTAPTAAGGGGAGVDLQKQSQPFEIYLKDFFEVKNVGTVMKISHQHMPHESDGLIFTPIKLPYKPGTCKQLLKWKPPEQNSVDFRIIWRDSVGLFELQYADKGISTGFEDGWLSPVGKFYKKHLLVDMTSCVDFQIVECRWDFDGWKFIPGDYEQNTERTTREQQLLGEGFRKFTETIPPGVTVAYPKTARGDHLRALHGNVYGRWKKGAWIAERFRYGISTGFEDGWLSPVGKFYKKHLLVDMTSCVDFQIVECRWDFDGWKFIPGDYEQNTERTTREQQLLGEGFRKFTETIPPGVTVAYPKTARGDHLRALHGNVYGRWKKGAWIAERFRYDKTTPNDKNVVDKVFQSIKDGIDIETLARRLKDPTVKSVAQECKMQTYFPTEK
uniref:mRNA guanylyltransferase n=1 Tax=Chromera velia CCMP2878 TaxID=1169474 RepID=A0A0G4GV92_9ALVE|eukprot:Cvel_23463.t1-p1 / transcript=Cvel_23463.t1 / gene=Cvel_23463 / organism=Chromera_velia_CCMP2878 / gene_product=mRNA-capping enzyme, putative / transcript_product=mRNA-capping enzyme, putative / location=Cvel_scaffold2420:4243-10619(-) / protein_length=676 / sequence_SO=supercontig / SO=protein_coding / is_pseudo=false